MRLARAKAVDHEKAQGFVELAIGVILLATALVGTFEVADRLYVLAKVREAAREAAVMVGRYDPSYLVNSGSSVESFLQTAVGAQLADLGRRVSVGTVGIACAYDTDPERTSVTVRVPCTVQAIAPTALLPGLGHEWEITVEATLPVAPGLWLVSCNGRGT